MDVHVHTQDVAMPLGRTLPMPTDAAVASAEHLWEIGFPFHARSRLAGHRLIATDADWTAGAGSEIRDPIQALVMLLAGRTATLPQLTGIQLDPAAGPGADSGGKRAATRACGRDRRDCSRWRGSRKPAPS